MLQRHRHDIGFRQRRAEDVGADGGNAVRRGRCADDRNLALDWRPGRPRTFRSTASGRGCSGTFLAPMSWRAALIAWSLSPAGIFIGDRQRAAAENAAALSTSSRARSKPFLMAMPYLLFGPVRISTAPMVTGSFACAAAGLLNERALNRARSGKTAAAASVAIFMGIFPGWRRASAPPRRANLAEPRRCGKRLALSFRRPEPSSGQAPPGHLPHSGRRGRAAQLRTSWRKSCVGISWPSPARLAAS